MVVFEKMFFLRTCFAILDYVEQAGKEYIVPATILPYFPPSPMAKVSALYVFSK